MAVQNRLAESTSPYLRQHATNPVDWYPWCDEALARAKAEDKPILLSVGYSACHWCHVMAHESFEDDATAAVLNRDFVSIKLDREERPDIDATYQKVVQLMGQGGGWPLTVFLLPDGRPFYAGTYFPKESRSGRPGFVQLLGAITDLWTNKRADVEAQADQLARGVQAIAGIVDEERAAAEGQVGLGDLGALRLAGRRLVERVDPSWGGFGREPKFPNPTGLELLLALARGGDDDALAREAGAALALTLDKMAAGGIYDHLRGGFARYAVDRVWLVPHFEKMLYDNAQLLPLYAEASVRFHDRARWREVVRETVDYLVADMRDDSGLFYAATDADSEGEEGKYFCWTPAEIASVLGDETLARELCGVYGVTAAGNFEHGQSILHLRRPIEELAREQGGDEAALRARLDGARAKLLAHRYARVPPERDEKLITSWNALLVSGLCRAARAAARWGDGALATRLIELARTAGERLTTHHVDGEGRVLRASFEGRVHTRGVVDDVAYLARACLDLHAATLEPVWLERATRLAEHGLDRHLRPGEDGFFMTADDVDAPIERPESQHDGPIPAGVSVMIEVLARLDAAATLAESSIPGHGPGGPSARARRVIERTLERFRAAPAQPFAYASLMTAAAWASPRAAHVTVRGSSPADPRVRELASCAHGFALGSPEPVGVSFVADPSPSAIVCRGQVCSAPMATAAELEAALRGRS